MGINYLEKVRFSGKEIIADNKIQMESITLRELGELKKFCKFWLISLKVVPTKTIKKLSIHKIHDI